MVILQPVVAQSIKSKQSTHPVAQRNRDLWHQSSLELTQTLHKRMLDRKKVVCGMFKIQTLPSIPHHNNTIGKARTWNDLLLIVVETVRAHLTRKRIRDISVIRVGVDLRMVRWGLLGRYEYFDEFNFHLRCIARRLSDIRSMLLAVFHLLTHLISTSIHPISVTIQHLPFPPPPLPSSSSSSSSSSQQHQAGVKSKDLFCLSIYQSSFPSSSLAREQRDSDSSPALLRVYTSITPRLHLDYTSRLSYVSVLI